MMRDIDTKSNDAGQLFSSKQILPGNDPVNFFV